MSMYKPQLDDPTKRVLQTIQRLGVASGWQVMKEASVTGDDLVKAVRILVASSLVKASGNLSDPDEIGKAYFNIQPSNTGLVNDVLSA
jgi:hypothetical protein